MEFTSNPKFRIDGIDHPARWITKLIDEIIPIIREALDRRGKCHIMLTGGRSAKRFYSVWAERILEIVDIKNIVFYFTDERCVSPENPESNFKLVKDNLFPKGLPPGVCIYRMEGENANHKEAADQYASILPARIDVLLLSVGEDGHIASLFPYNQAIREKTLRVMPVYEDKLLSQRLSVTPSVIQDARTVFVMALGQKKRSIYQAALKDPKNVDSIPARLVLDRAWILGT